MTVEINGNEISQQIINRLKNAPIPEKKLVAVLVGNDPASLSFIRQKGRTAGELGISFELKQIPVSTPEATVKDTVQKVSTNNAVGGVILQLPLPDNLPAQEILNIIPADKDVDNLSQESVKLFEAGHGKIRPPAVETVEEIISHQNYSLKDKTIAVVGLGRLVGHPITTWLKERVDRLIKIDINRDLKQIRDADLVICGTGQPQLISPNVLKGGAAVIDFGYGKINNRISGDLDTSNKQQLAKLSFYTPTPGGTGPILVTKLLENFYQLNQ